MKATRIGRLPRWQRWFTHSVLTICGVSGLIFFLKQDVGWWDGRRGAHDVLIIHGISAAFAIMAMGAVLPAHIRVSIMARRNIMSGFVMLAVMAALMVSGLALYYGSEEMREASELTHEFIGFLAFMAVPAHILFGKFAGVKRR
jgi:hypothetical protein